MADIKRRQHTSNTYKHVCTHTSKRATRDATKRERAATSTNNDDQEQIAGTRNIYETNTTIGIAIQGLLFESKQGRESK